MNEIIRKIEAEQLKENAPEFHVGDTVKVYAKIKEGTQPQFKAFWFPVGNYICLAFFMGLLGVMLSIDGISLSVYLMPAWLLFLAIIYKFLRK